MKMHLLACSKEHLRQKLGSKTNHCPQNNKPTTAKTKIQTHYLMAVFLPRKHTLEAGTFFLRVQANSKV